MASGLLLVDKPRGPSSFTVVAEVRRRTGERRVGHGGTLDPLASGLLPVLLGPATRLAGYLLGLGKVYRATVRLGTATDTYDAEGRVTAAASPTDLAGLGEPELRRALGEFVGEIRQRPPAFSALKRDGQPLYRLARRAIAGERVETEERTVRIDRIDLDGFAPPDVQLTVRCGKGTYIRSLAHDLGERLGVHGHLAALRRTAIGPFDVSRAVDVFAAVPLPTPLPMAEAVRHLPAVDVDEQAARRLRLGQQAGLGALCGGRTAGPLRLVGPGGNLVAIAGAADGHWQLLHVFQ